MNDDFVIQPSGGDVPEVPDSLYTATVVNVTPVKLEVPDQYGKSAKVDISVQFEVDGATVQIDPRVNQAWSEKATLFTIAIACGLDVNPNGAFHPRQLIGRQVNILTEQEEGKWPRVKAWSRVQTKKATRSSEEPTQASKSPAVITSDGEPDYDSFWRAVTSLGLNQKHVFDKAGSIEAFQKLDGPGVAFLLEELKVQVEAVV